VDINSLPLKKFSKRLGLVEQPQVKLNSIQREKKFSNIMQKLAAKLEEVGSSSEDSSDDSNESDGESDEETAEKSESKSEESDNEEMSDVDETSITEQEDDELPPSDDDGYTGSDEAINEDDDLEDLVDDKKKKVCGFKKNQLLMF
jgi:hypothetical protein